MRIAVACDHAGFEYKEKLVAFLRDQGHEVKDFGTHTPDSVDYPDTVHPMSFAIEAGRYERGIVLCGSGNGVAMTANKHQWVRCALCWQVDIAQLARLHNDANVLALGAGIIGLPLAKEIVSVWLAEAFQGGRHKRRVDKIMELEAR